MSIFKKLFSSNNSKEHFLAGWYVSLDNNQELESFLLTQGIDKTTAKNLDNYIHLVYDDKGLLSDAKIYSEGKVETNEHLNENLHLEKAIGVLKYQDLPTHKMYDFVQNDKGVHQIGGEFPADFIIPKNKFVVPFQYLGYINNTDKTFDWLPFKLHMICPIFLNLEFLFLDYSDPLSPTIINQEQVEKADTAYEDDLNTETEIIFNELRFNTKDIGNYGFGIGLTGIPKWIQHHDIPRCPKTNKTMKFVCQLQGGVTAKRTNVTPKDEYYRQYYEELNFWGDGDLFLFFEPTSRVACYFIQNT